jgi:hypothetical protein
VTAEANLEPVLFSLATTWQAIGSTIFAQARVHTGTDPSITGIPIYLLSDTKLADDYADLWDGSIDAPLSVDQYGLSTGPGSVIVWTGGFADGLWAAGNRLSETFPLYGLAGSTTSTWMYSSGDAEASSHRLYAISGVLTVPVPEAGSAAMLALGCAALLLLRRVRPS